MSQDPEGRDDDDDLPVLTQVLRTGQGRMPSTTPSRAVDRAPEALAVRPLDEILVADALVIGHEPQHPVDPDVRDSWMEPDHGIATDGADHFRLPHDHDLTSEPTAAFIRTIAVPEVVVASADREPAREQPAERVERDEAFAQRIRDAVLEDLMTRIDTELDARIAQALHAEVETAVAQLQSRLRSRLAEALRDVVGRAVDEEMARTNGSPTRH